MFCRAVLISTFLTGWAIAAVSAEELPVEQPLIDWETFVSDRGQFQVAMPSQPAVYTFTPGTETADSLMYMQMQLAETDRLEIYAAAFITSASFVTSSETIETALLSCVTSLSEQALQSIPQAITLGEYQGIEAEFRDERGLLQISRCYLVGDRAYLLTASSEPFNAGSGLLPLETTEVTSELSEAVMMRSPTMGTFFDSFKILD